MKELKKGEQLALVRSLTKFVLENQDKRDYDRVELYNLFCDTAAASPLYVTDPEWAAFIMEWLSMQFMEDPETLKTVLAADVRNYEYEQRRKKD